MIHTQVVWEMPLTEEQVAGIDNKLVEIGDKQVQPPEITQDPESGHSIGDRFWEDTESAAEWVDFVLTLGPVSANIVP
jgi:hypothetical protein